MILPDHMIAALVDSGAITLDPYLPGSVQPASYDLRLGPVVLLSTPDGDREHDLRNNPLALYEGQCALGATLEWVGLPADLTAQLAGKSTLARKGLQICCDAGYVDPGWRGRLTLELRHTKPRPVYLYHDMPICQIVFIQMAAAAARPYGTPGLGSKYQDSNGPVAARETWPSPVAPDKRTAIFILHRAGRVLMEWRKYGTYEGYVYPGGKIRPGETPDQALAREFAEELGTPLGDATVTPLADIAGFDGYHVWPYVVTGWDGAVPERTDKGDRLDWVSLADAGKQTLWATTDPVILAALRRLREMVP